MGKLIETRVPLPHERPISTAKAAPKPAAKAAPAPNAKSARKPRATKQVTPPPVKAPVVEESSESSEEESSEEETTSNAQTGTSKDDDKSSVSDTEEGNSDEEGDSEEEEESAEEGEESDEEDDGLRVTQPRQNGMAQQTSTEVSASGEDDDEEVDEISEESTGEEEGSQEDEESAEESNSSVDEVAETPVKAKPQVGAEPSGSEDEDSSSEQEESSSGSGGVTPNGVKTTAKLNAPTLQEEESSGSSGSEDEEEESEIESSSNITDQESSSSVEEDEDVVMVDGAADRRAKTASSSSEESSAEEAAPKPSTSAKGSLQATQFRLAPPHIPPQGFQAIPPGALSSKLSDTLQIDGKQIWHITAPADVPISTLTEVALSKIKKGEPVTTYKDTEYRFIVGDESENATTKLLLPTSDGYKSVSRVSQTLHLQQVVRLSGVPSAELGERSAPDNSAQAYRPKPKSIRQQPKGLKMRFKPSGFGSSDPGILGWSDSEEDIEMVDEPSVRKKDVVNGMGGKSDKPAKKKKKHASEKEKTELNSGVDTVNGVKLDTPSSKPQKRKTEDNGSAKKDAPTTPAPPVGTDDRDKPKKKRKRKEREGKTSTAG